MHQKFASLIQLPAHIVLGGVLVYMHRLHSSAEGSRKSRMSGCLTLTSKHPTHLCLIGVGQVKQPEPAFSISCKQGLLHRAPDELGSTDSHKGGGGSRGAGLPVQVEAWREGVLITASIHLGPARIAVKFFLELLHGSC